MFSGVALAACGVPVDLVIRHGLSQRVYDRGGEKEFQFLLCDGERVLPVWLDGRLQIARWGTSSRLPCTAWTWLTTFESGNWREAGASRS
jgi:hypothetical protein